MMNVLLIALSILIGLASLIIGAKRKEAGWFPIMFMSLITAVYIGFLGITETKESNKRNHVLEQATEKFKTTDVHITRQDNKDKYEIIIGNDLYEVFLFENGRKNEVRFLKVSELE